MNLEGPELEGQQLPGKKKRKAAYTGKETSTRREAHFPKLMTRESCGLFNHILGGNAGSRDVKNLHSTLSFALAVVTYSLKLT
jgi:hypothetical protein